MNSPYSIKKIAPIVVLATMLVTCTDVLAQNAGPATPSAAGQNPLLGFILAVILSVLVIVVSIMPSKRQSEDV